MSDNTAGRECLFPRVWHVVYALVYKELRKVVYVGCTKNEAVRERQHLKHTFQPGKDTRVKTALSQPRFQPRDNHFEFRIFWKGDCTDRQASAIEQHYIDKFDTRVVNRPEMDKDILNNGDPLQLNVLPSCTNQSLLEWAKKYVEDGCDVHLQGTDSFRWLDECMRKNNEWFEENLRKHNKWVESMTASKLSMPVPNTPLPDAPYTSMEVQLEQWTNCTKISDIAREERGKRNRFQCEQELALAEHEAKKSKIDDDQILQKAQDILDWAKNNDNVAVVESVNSMMLNLVASLAAKAGVSTNTDDDE